MPQLDSSTFFSQLTVSILFFSILFFFVVSVVLPSIYKAQRTRDLALSEADLQISVISSMLWLTNVCKQIVSDVSVSGLESSIFHAVDGADDVPCGVFTSDCIRNALILSPYREKINFGTESSEDLQEIADLVLESIDSHDVEILEREPVLDEFIEEYGLFANVTLNDCRQQLQILRSADSDSDDEIGMSVSADDDDDTIVYSVNEDFIEDRVEDEDDEVI